MPNMEALMSETAYAFSNGAAAIRDWAVNCARTGRAHFLDPELVLAVLHELEALEARIEKLEDALEFYAADENWSTMGLDEYRAKYGTEPSSEAKVGRMRLVAPGRALPAVLRDVGERAKTTLAADAPATE
jgi:hypothetical protein